MLYKVLLISHGIVRWLVLILLIASIIVSIRRRPFTKAVNALRHWTATTAHIQLMIGIVLYVRSPFVKVDFFFRVVHISMMLAAIVLLTIGSAMAKRKPTDQEKYRTMLIWFGAALLLILLAIPWPFSPLAPRPLFRTF